MMKMKQKIDLSEFFNYTTPQPVAPPPIKQVDMSLCLSKRAAAEDIGISLDTINGDLGVTIIEAEYRKAIPIVITEADVNRWILGGAPMY